VSFRRDLVGNGGVSCFSQLINSTIGDGQPRPFDPLNPFIPEIFQRYLSGIEINRESYKAPVSLADMVEIVPNPMVYGEL
jgi:hypothetical protein